MGSCSSRNSNNSDAVIRHDLPNLLMEMDADNNAFRPSRRRGRRGRHDDEVRLGEIMALQQSLAAMEDFFQSLLGQANFYMEALDPQNGASTSTGPPPISKRALDELPLLSGNCQSLVCGVCGEGGADTWLPCGHTYHKAGCVEPWLTRHCTCPVCRYELPTDDESYEPGRVERMSLRKIGEEEAENATNNEEFDSNSVVQKTEEYEPNHHSEEAHHKGEDQKQQEDELTDISETRSIERID